MISGIIAFCKFCKKFHEYQDYEAHDEGVDVPYGVTVWEPLVMPVIINPMSLDKEKALKYTVARLNKILEENSSPIQIDMDEGDLFLAIEMIETLMGENEEEDRVLQILLEQLRTKK